MKQNLIAIIQKAPVLIFFCTNLMCEPKYTSEHKCTPHLKNDEWILYCIRIFLAVHIHKKLWHIEYVGWVYGCEVMFIQRFAWFITDFVFDNELCRCLVRIVCEYWSLIIGQSVSLHLWVLFSWVPKVHRARSGVNARNILLLRLAWLFLLWKGKGSLACFPLHSFCQLGQNVRNIQTVWTHCEKWAYFEGFAMKPVKQWKVS